MFPTALLDKICNITRQTAGAGTATLTTVATGIKCAAYGASGWNIGSDGGQFDNRPQVYLLDATGSQISGGLQDGDFLEVFKVIPGGTVNFIVRRINFWQNQALSRSSVLYSTSLEPAPSGNL
jgi:hypothetical protein